MRKIFNYANLTQQQWEEKRNALQGIGGSDIAVVLGISQYKTARRLYLEKRGEIERQPVNNEAAKMGHILEPVVAKLFAEETGLTVRNNNWILQHDTIDCMFANIDREVLLPEGGRAVLEIKTASEWLASEWQEDHVPTQYMAQVQFYLSITGYKKAYIAVLIGGNKFRYWEIEKDPEVIAHLEETAQSFWQMVQEGTLPAIDGSDDAAALLLESYPDAEESEWMQPEDPDLLNTLSDKHDSRKIIDKQIKELTAQKKAIDNYMKDLIGQADAIGLKLPDGRKVKWGIANKKKLDKQAFEEAHSDLIREYEEAKAQYEKPVTERRISY